MIRRRVATTIAVTALVCAGVISHAVFAARISQYTPARVFGGPNAFAAVNRADASDGAFKLVTPVGESIIDDGMMSASLALIENTALVNPNPLSGGSPLVRDGVSIYTVRSGDTLSGIAAEFGISLNTILWANPKIGSRYLGIGEELIILPVSGVLHRVRDGETLRSIVRRYGVSENRIISANSAALQQFGDGVALIIPGGRPYRRAAARSVKLPNLAGYFVLPTTGWNWGELHAENAVDIANVCGTTVYAAAEGLVTRIGTPSRWNGGYGGFVEIEHPNKTRTRYAHLHSISVSPGDYVAQRQLIAEMGNTGNVRGRSGCHLHFEVSGAKNPFAK